MKKIFLSAGFIIMTAVAGAQIVQPAQTPAAPASAADTDNKGFKPDGGSATFEMNFAPSFTAMPISLNYIRLRYFLSEGMAVRAGISLAIRSASDNRVFEYAILPGIEKHFSGSDRLSPYIGGELIIGGKSASSTSTSGSGNSLVTTETSGAWSNGSNQGFFNFGINGVIGCDFYFSKRIYMGLEGGFGFSLMSFSDVTTTVIPNGGSTTVTTSAGGSSFSLGPNYNSAIRVGFVF